MLSHSPHPVTVWQYGMVSRWNIRCSISASILGGSVKVYPAYSHMRNQDVGLIALQSVRLSEVYCVGLKIVLKSEDRLVG